VPPKAANIGSAEVMASGYCMDMHNFSIGGTSIALQKMISRLVVHGPVTRRPPTFILHMLPTDVFVSESIAWNIEPVWDKEY
jgi:glucosamine-6-phosphate deaminase